MPWGTAGQLVESSPGTRRRYITAALIAKHKPTQGCPGCNATGVHSERCRDRFEKIILAEEQKKQRTVRAVTDEKEQRTAEVKKDEVPAQEEQAQKEKDSGMDAEMLDGEQQSTLHTST